MLFTSLQFLLMLKTMPFLYVCHQEVSLSVDLTKTWCYFNRYYRCYFNISETIAFHTVLTLYSIMREESAVLFDRVLLNKGDGWVSS